MSRVWISGASSGIGHALVHATPGHPGKIIGISRRGIGDTSGIRADVTYEDLRADLSTPDGWALVARSFRDELANEDGPVTFMHCAATVGPLGYAGEVDPDAYQRAIVLNTVAPQVLGQAFVAAVNDAGVDGCLVMLSSGSSSGIYQGWSAYKPGKVAVDEWVRAVGAEQRTKGGRCRVLSVTPGLVQTQMQQALRDASPEDFPRRDKFVAANDAGDVRSPEEVALRIWQVVDEDHDNGATIDLRSLSERDD